MSWAILVLQRLFEQVWQDVLQRSLLWTSRIYWKNPQPNPVKTMIHRLLVSQPYKSILRMQKGRSLLALITLRLYAHYDWYYSLDSLVTWYHWCVYYWVVHLDPSCHRSDSFPCSYYSRKKSDEIDSFDRFIIRPQKHRNRCLLV